MDLIGKYRQWKRTLKEGPDWIRIPDLVVSANYRSPTVLLIAWCYGWYIRWFTMPGRLVAAIFPLILGYTVLSVRTPIRTLALALLALFLIDFFVGLLFRPRLTIRRTVPDRARAGSDVTVEYELVNRRNWSALDLEIDRYLSEKGLRLPHGPAVLPILDSHARQTVNCTVCGVRRGVYMMPRPIADSRFPLALFKWSCRDGQQHKLHIYPAFEPLLTLELPVGKRFQKEGVSRVSKVGESMDFAGCRDFRSGDEPRHIHWRSSARAGHLVVKEYQEEYLSRVAVIVDTHVTKPRFSFRLKKSTHPEYRDLEAAIALAASLADFLARGDYVIDFFAAGPEVYHFQGGRSLSCLDGILDILACLEPNHARPILEMTPEVMHEVAGIGSAVVILLGWDEERRSFIEQLRQRGVAVKTIVVGTAGGLPGDIRGLDPADILAGKVTRL